MPSSSSTGGWLALLGLTALAAGSLVSLRKRSDRHTVALADRWVHEATAELADLGDTDEDRVEASRRLRRFIRRKAGGKIDNTVHAVVGDAIQPLLMMLQRIEESVGQRAVRQVPAIPGLTPEEITRRVNQALVEGSLRIGPHGIPEPVFLQDTVESIVTRVPLPNRFAVGVRVMEMRRVTGEPLTPTGRKGTITKEPYMLGASNFLRVKWDGSAREQEVRLQDVRLLEGAEAVASAQPPAERQMVEAVMVIIREMSEEKRFMFATDCAAHVLTIWEQNNPDKPEPREAILLRREIGSGSMPHRRSELVEKIESYTIGNSVIPGYQKHAAWSAVYCIRSENSIHAAESAALDARAAVRDLAIAHARAFGGGNDVAQAAGERAYQIELNWQHDIAMSRQAGNPPAVELPASPLPVPGATSQRSDDLLELMRQMTVQQLLQFGEACVHRVRNQFVRAYRSALDAERFDALLSFVGERYGAATEHEIQEAHTELNSFTRGTGEGIGTLGGHAAEAALDLGHAAITSYHVTQSFQRYQNESVYGFVESAILHSRIASEESVEELRQQILIARMILGQVAIATPEPAPIQTFNVRDVVRTPEGEATVLRQQTDPSAAVEVRFPGGRWEAFNPASIMLVRRAYVPEVGDLVKVVSREGRSTQSATSERGAEPSDRIIGTIWRVLDVHRGFVDAELVSSPDIRDGLSIIDLQKVETAAPTAPSAWTPYVGQRVRVKSQTGYETQNADGNLGLAPIGSTWVVMRVDRTKVEAEWERHPTTHSWLDIVDLEPIGAAEQNLIVGDRVIRRDDVASPQLSENGTVTAEGPNFRVRWVRNADSVPEDENSVAWWQGPGPIFGLGDEWQRGQIVRERLGGRRIGMVMGANRLDTHWKLQIHFDGTEGTVSDRLENFEPLTTAQAAALRTPPDPLPQGLIDDVVRGYVEAAGERAYQIELNWQHDIAMSRQAGNPPAVELPASPFPPQPSPAQTAAPPAAWTPYVGQRVRVKSQTGRLTRNAIGGEGMMGMAAPIDSIWVVTSVEATRIKAKWEQNPLIHSWLDIVDLEPVGEPTSSVPQGPLDEFERGYIEAALATSDECDEDGNNCVPLDRNYDEHDLAYASLVSIREDCASFRRDNAADLDESRMTASQTGQDFWLTRNGYGGFWDRGLGEVGVRLSAAAEAFGSSDLYVGDDGKLYVT